MYATEAAPIMLSTHLVQVAIHRLPAGSRARACSSRGLHQNISLPVTINHGLDGWCGCRTGSNSISNNSRVCTATTAATATTATQIQPTTTKACTRSPPQLMLLASDDATYTSHCSLEQRSLSQWSRHPISL